MRRLYAIIQHLNDAVWRFKRRSSDNILHGALMNRRWPIGTNGMENTSIQNFIIWRIDEENEYRNTWQLRDAAFKKSKLLIAS